MITRWSNEWLEDQIAMRYQEAARVAPGVGLKEEGFLEVLWAEFDERVVRGLIEVE